jgi:hypothetical protein
MKKTYINPACKVRTMKIEAILANTIIGGPGGSGMGFGGGDGEGGAGADANRKSLWDEEE